MLTAIRANVGSWVVKILFGLLILSFAAWGLNDLFSEPDPRELTAAEVGDREILVGEVEDRFRREATRLQQMFGPDFDLRQAADLGLDRQALDSLILEALQLNAAEDFNLNLSNDYVAAQVRQQPIFQSDVTGRFDRQRFLAILAQNQLSEGEYVQSLRRDLLRNTVGGTVTAAGHTPTVLNDALLRYRQERRSADVLTLSHDALTVTPVPSQSDLRTFYNDNPDDFTAPEYRAITAITLTVDDLIDEIAVSEEELEQAYQANLDRFVTPELRAFNQVLVTDEATAQDIADAARSAGSLGAGVAEVGAEVEVIALDPAPQDGFLPDVGAAGFALAEGEISDPVSSPFGFHVLEVTAIEAGGERPLSAVRDELRREVAAEGALDALFMLANDLQDALAGGETLEEAANRLDLPLHTVPAVDTTGSTPDGEAPSIPLVEPIVREAFALSPGETGFLQESADDAYFVVRVDGVTPPALRPFEEVAGRVEAAWTLQARAEAAGRLAERARDRLLSGDDPQSVADALGFTLQTVDGVLRDGTDRGPLPSTGVRPLFDLPEGGAAVVSGSNAQAVVQLTGIMVPDPADLPDRRAVIASETAEATSSDLGWQVNEGLRQIYGVTVNEDRLDRVVPN